jgi:transcriptional regulator with XRE-family HTH domain
LARLAGLSPSMLSSLESGERPPPLRVIQALADAFQVAPPTLITPEGWGRDRGA